MIGSSPLVAPSPTAPAAAVDGTRAADRPIVVASYNVHKCVGVDRQFDPRRIARVIGELGADVVAVQEADRRFGRRSGLLDATALKDECGLSLVPISELADGHGWHGNALLLKEGSVTRLRRLVLPGAEPRGAVLVELSLPAGRLRIIGAHFGLLRRCRIRQALTVMRAMAEGDSIPTLLLGDLNEWRPGRRSSLRSLESVFGPVSPGPATFPSRLPVLALDRIFGWPNGIVSDIRAHQSPLARIASDHLPLKAAIHLGAGAAALQAGEAEAA